MFNVILYKIKLFLYQVVLLCFLLRDLDNYAYMYHFCI